MMIGKQQQIKLNEYEFKYLTKQWTGTRGEKDFAATETSLILDSTFCS